MCIAIYKAKGLTAKKEVYAECFRANPDGAGFVVRERTGELKIEKGFFTFQNFWEAFQPHQSKQSIIHFRIKTHGNIDEENSHPFWVKEGHLAFAHNGIITNQDTATDHTKSDTWHFNKDVLQHLLTKYGEDAIEDPVLQGLITEYIGYSKLAFLREDGKAWIFNKNLGTTDFNGIWFSNHSYKVYDWHKNRVKTKTVYPVYSPLAALVNKSLDESAANDPVAEQERQDLEAIQTASRMYERGDMGEDFKHEALRKLLVKPADIKRPDSKLIMAGDYIQMVQSFNNLKGDEIGKVLHVNSDYTVDAVMHQYGTMAQRSIRLPYYAFERYITPIQ